MCACVCVVGTGGYVDIKAFEVGKKNKKKKRSGKKASRAGSISHSEVS